MKQVVLGVAVFSVSVVLVAQQVFLPISDSFRYIGIAIFSVQGAAGLGLTLLGWRVLVLKRKLRDLISSQGKEMENEGQ